MGLGIQWEVIAAFAAGIALLYFAGRLLLAPLRLIGRLVLNGIAGGLMLLLVNLLGSVLGIHININPVTALTAGFLGIPGVIMLLLLELILK